MKTKLKVDRKQFLKKQSSTTKKTSKEKKINVKKLFQLTKNDCKYHIEDNGKMRHFSKDIGHIYMSCLCMLFKNIHFDGFIFPYLYGDETRVIKKLLILHKMQEEGIYYILAKKKDKESHFPDYEAYLLWPEFIRSLCTFRFLADFEYKKDPKFLKKFLYKYSLNQEDFFYRVLVVNGIFVKLYKDISSNEILTILFYSRYIKLIQSELVEKYGVHMSDFENYHQLYIFLKKKGYVKNFYKIMGPIVLQKIDESIKLIQNHPLFDSYVNQYQRKMKPLRQMKIPKLLDQFLPKIMNKEKIYESFLSYIRKS
jgi:hypothetical protein